jgi:thymidylate synthase ThyX
MSYSAEIITDSLSPSGARLVTMQCTMPRIILAEYNTHRQFSRNSASSRAIPVKKQIERLIDDSFVPAEWGCNKPGMQADGILDHVDSVTANNLWDAAKENAIEVANSLANLGVHKQLVSRLLEPFMWHTVITSATQWGNFFSQRCHKDAQPEMQTIARMMLAAYKASKPNPLGEGNWHLPYITEQDIEAYPVPLLLQLSVARCARVSYLSHDGKHDPEADLELFKKLHQGNHWSPFEHVAMAINESEPYEYKNFSSGFIQYRSLMPNENVTDVPKT